VLTEIENKNLILEQYKIYLNLKDKFTNRSFNTNKFFITISIILFALIFTYSKVPLPFHVTTAMIFSLIGMGICILWWSNVDTYEIFNLIKIKNVIDKLEAEMPFKCHYMEKEALDELKAKRKAFVFSDIQKIIAIGVFIIFMVLFLHDAVPAIVKGLHIKLVI